VAQDSECVQTLSGALKMDLCGHAQPAVEHSGTVHRMIQQIIPYSVGCAVGHWSVVGVPTITVVARDTLNSRGSFCTGRLRHREDQQSCLEPGALLLALCSIAAPPLTRNHRSHPCYLEFEGFWTIGEA
jgi:hypothetical protein